MTLLLPDTKYTGIWRNRRPELSEEALILAFSVIVVGTLNSSFLATAIVQHSPDSFGGVAFLAATLILLIGLHGFIFGLLGLRWMLRPMLAISWTVGVMAAYYIQRYTVYLDPGMLRNILHTQPKEALELVTLSMITTVLAASVPVWVVLAWITVRPTSTWRWLLRRTLWLIACLTVTIGSGLLAYRDLSALLRNHREARYLVTPANVFASAFAVLKSSLREAHQPRIPIGLDAMASRESGTRPRVLVIVVGETVRAQNWGLNGYDRDTTPKLRKHAVINFSDVSACGSDTEVSLPCMFAPVGRRDYDEDRIRGQQSLLHVLERVGVATHWIDNQTGCKGVCDGLRFETLRGDSDAILCDGQACLDGALFAEAKRTISNIAAQSGDQVLILHQLGNHGPAYSRRYPASFRKFTPTCESPDFKGCNQQSITNSYDNAILYTDDLLSGLIDTLSKRDDLESTLIYVSDHGESLGEGGIYLHGLPYLIAPPVQLKVPMLVWLSDTMTRSARVDSTCLAAQQAAPHAHDHLFHSVLGLFSIKTVVYDPAWDMFAPCRGLTAS